MTGAASHSHHTLNPHPLHSHPSGGHITGNLAGTSTGGPLTISGRPHSQQQGQLHAAAAAAAAEPSAKKKRPVPVAPHPPNPQSVGLRHPGGVSMSLKREVSMSLKRETVPPAAAAAALPPGLGPPAPAAAPAPAPAGVPSLVEEGLVEEGDRRRKRQKHAHGPKEGLSPQGTRHPPPPGPPLPPVPSKSTHGGQGGLRDRAQREREEGQDTNEGRVMAAPSSSRGLSRVTHAIKPHPPAQASVGTRLRSLPPPPKPTVTTRSAAHHVGAAEDAFRPLPPGSVSKRAGPPGRIPGGTNSPQLGGGGIMPPSGHDLGGGVPVQLINLGAQLGMTTAPKRQGSGLLASNAGNPIAVAAAAAAAKLGSGKGKMGMPSAPYQRQYDLGGRVPSSASNPSLMLPPPSLMHPHPHPSHLKHAHHLNAPCSLVNSLASFVKAENLPMGETWLCGRCKVPRVAIKQLSIRRLPPILAIHIKRFEHGFQHGKRSGPSTLSRKIQDLISFPMRFDMEPFTSGHMLREKYGCKGSLDPIPPVKSKGKGIASTSEGGGGDEREGKESTRVDSPYAPAPRLDCTYSLLGVVCHKGDISGGHYVSYVKKEGAWYCFDDAWVTRVEESTVSSCQAYMLFYKRCSR